VGSRLLVTGLLLLGGSLLVNLVLLLSVPSLPLDSPVVAGALSWCAQAMLYVGAGLTVAGALLRELRAPERQPSDPIDYYG
jgi:hypothetical protein